MFMLDWKRWRIVLMAFAAAALVACGGGGGGDGGAPAPGATAPTISAQPQAQAVPEGQAATFSVTASGTEPFSYQWQRNGADIAGATGASYTLAAPTAADSGAQFRVVISNSAGSATSSSVALTVNRSALAPAITTQPQNATVTAGQSATFTVAATGTAPLGYQWQRNGANIAGANGASYTTPATTTGDSGAVFTVIVSNAAQTSVTSAAATLTVNAASSTPVAPSITAQLQNVSATVGQTATFSVVATGTPAPSYQWKRNGTDIAGATAASYTTPVLTPADNGASFTVVVSNSAGSVTSAAAVLTVGAAPLSVAAPRIAAGGRPGFTFSAARSTSVFWTWGANLRGSIGDGSLNDRALPFAWSLGATTAVTLGSESTMLIDSTGTGYWAGIGTLNGESGTGNIGQMLTPTKVTVQSGITAAAVGDGYTVAALANGTVWGWGALPTGVRTSISVQLGGFADIVSLCVDDESILGLKRDGTVWFAGTDRGGAMAGQGRSITSAVTTALQVSGLTDIVQIACGSGKPTSFGLALRRDGIVFSWGDAGGLGYAIPVGQYVQLTAQQIPTLSGVTWVAAANTGNTAAFAVTSDGRVRAWGYDTSGALALGSISASTPVVTPTLSAAIDNVVEVATSGEHTLFVKRDGSVWAVGSNASGQLGNTSPAAVGSSVTPVQVTGLNVN